MSTENTPLFFLAFVFLSLHEGIQADGVSQFSLTSPSMGNYSCPGNNITYTCVVCPTLNAIAITIWSGSAFQCAPNQILLTQKAGGTVQPFTPVSCGSLSAVTTSNASTCYTSVLTIPAVQAASNGATVQCADGVSITIVGTDTLKIISPPGAPNVMAKTIDPDMVLVVVNPSSSGGLPTSYNVNISNSSYVSTKSTPAFLNGSAMVTFTGLTNTTTYTISAVAINCAGSSNPATTISVSWPATTTSPSPSSRTTTPSPTIAITQNSTTDPKFGIIIGVVVGVVFLVVLIVISIVICVFLCKPSNGSKPNKIDGQDGQPLAQVKVELSEEPVPARPPRQVPAEESHGKTQANRVPIEEALYDGNVGPGGMAPGRGGYTQEAQYSTPDVSKKNADKQMYAEVQVSTAPKNTASSSKKGKGVLPPHSTQEGVFYSTVKT